MLCFEIWKNGKKLTVAGVRESGVVSFVLSWVGKGAGASARAAAAEDAVPGLHFHVGGIDSSDPDGDKTVEWVEKPNLKIGDELRVRLIAAGTATEPASKNAVPASRVEDEIRVIQCSFCGKMRQSESKSWLKPGVAGASVFICTRCLILAERTLHDRLEQLFHLTRAADHECSFCETQHTAESVVAKDASMCRTCVDMMMA